MAFATNYGEGYLPYVMDNNDTGINFFIMSTSQKDEKVSNEIANMNIVRVTLGLFGEISGGSPQFRNSMVNDSVTNVWVDS
jgi:hypothetical protein